MSVETGGATKKDVTVYHVGECLRIFKTFIKEPSVQNELYKLKDDIRTAKRVWKDCATQYVAADSESLFGGGTRKCSEYYSNVTQSMQPDPRAECKPSDKKDSERSLPYLSEDDIAWWTGREGNIATFTHQVPNVTEALMSNMQDGCGALNSCMQALEQCEEPFDCCESMDDESPHNPRNYTRCKAEHKRFQRGEKGSIHEPAIPWPPYVCDYRVKRNFGVIGYDKSLASFHGVSVHSCARKCFESIECQSFDFREETADHFAANCILRPLTAARVLNFAFGQSEAGWSYYETKARGDLTDGSDASKSDVFNTCGKAVGRALPPKRGAAVVFFKANTWLEVGSPLYGTPADVEQYNVDVFDSIDNSTGVEIISDEPIETVLELAGEGRTLRNGGLPNAMRKMCNKGDVTARKRCQQELDQQWAGPLSGPSDQWLRDGYGMNATSGMPDILLFGGVYDDGCTSQETWMFNAQANQWGWRDALGEFHQGPMPDPLCENDALLQQKNNLQAMKNKLLIAKISPWQRYQYRRLGLAKYSEVIDKLPPTPKLCPPTARVGASGLRWGRRFVMFGGAQWRRSLKSPIDPRFNLDEEESAETVDALRSHDLYDVLMTDELSHEDGVGQNDATEFIPARSHTRRAQTMFNDVWVLEQRLSGGLLTSVNWFWSLLSSDGAMLRPMGRYDAATMIVEERSTMYIFGGRSFNRSYNDLWSFDLLTRVWRELTPEKGDRPMPRHGAAIASLKNAGGFMDGTLIMSFGREISPWRGPEITIGDMFNNVSVSEAGTVQLLHASGPYRKVRWVGSQPSWHGVAEVCAICEKGGETRPSPMQGGKLRSKREREKTSERAHPDGASSGSQSSSKEKCNCGEGWRQADPDPDVEEDVSVGSKVIVRNEESKEASFYNPRHSETFFREIWTFSAVHGWKKLDFERLCGCNVLTWDSKANTMKRDCVHGDWEWRCPQGRWGHAMVIPNLRSYDRTQDGMAATPKAEEPTFATFVGGWGEDGRAVRTVLKLYFENSLSYLNTPCETSCFEETALDEDSQLAAPCEECDPEDACFADHMRGPRVSPLWACGTAREENEIDADTSRCPSAHLPLVCSKSGSSHSSKADRNVSSAHFQSWAPGGYPLKRLDENALLYPARSARPAGQEYLKNMTGITVWGDNLPVDWSFPGSPRRAASFQNPCRQTSDDADFEDLSAVNAAEQWDENGVAKLVVYSCSRLKGAISLDISSLGLNGFTARRGKGYRKDDLVKYKSQLPPTPLADVWKSEPSRPHWRMPTATGHLDDSNNSIASFPREEHRGPGAVLPGAGIETHVHPAGDLFKWEVAEPGTNLNPHLQGWDKESWIGGPTMTNNYPWSRETTSLLAQYAEMPWTHTDSHHAKDDDEFTVLHRMPKSYVISGGTLVGVDGTYERRVFRSPNVPPLQPGSKLSILYERVRQSLSHEKAVVLLREADSSWFIAKNDTTEMGCVASTWCKLYTAPSLSDSSGKWDAPGAWRAVPGHQTVPALKANPQDFARHILSQSCPNGEVGGMQPVCYQVSLGWCKEQCETYSSPDVSMCCDSNSPKGATDFFNRPCYNPVPSDVKKLRCQACTGFAYNAVERSCVLTHSDWFRDQFYPEEELSDVEHSTFYVREAVLGHVAGADGHTHHRHEGSSGPPHFHKHSYIRCPYMSSGYYYMNRSDIASDVSRLPRQPRPTDPGDVIGQAVAAARSPISDLEMCTGTDKLWTGTAFNGKPVSLENAGHTPYEP